MGNLPDVVHSGQRERKEFILSGEIEEADEGGTETTSSLLLTGYFYSRSEDTQESVCWFLLSRVGPVWAHWWVCHPDKNDIKAFT